jgi:hypothetical protein
MTANFLFIPENIEDNGHAAATVIQILPAIHCLIVSHVIAMHIKDRDIQMHNVIVAIPEAPEIKNYL